MQPIIRLKYYNRQQPCSQQELAQVTFGHLNVPFIRIFSTSDGFKVICRNEQDADKLLSNEAEKELKKIGVFVLTPPEIKAKRSIFIRNLDYIIGQHTEEELKEELEKENDWAKITEIIKIKNYTSMLKLRFVDMKMVEKAKQHGLLAYNMAISTHQIEQEEYIHITTCYKCYELEDHETKDCPYNDLIICSECSETGHTFKNCEKDVKQCINCKKNGQESNHRTLAMACPIRKSLFKDKLQKGKDRASNKEQTKYVEIARKVVEETKQNNNTTHIHLSDQKHTKILISIMHAHVINISNPGSYQKELNKMLEMNNLPTMWFPDNPQSSKLLGASASKLTPEIITEPNETTTTTEESMTTVEIEQEHRTTKQTNRDPRLERKRLSQESSISPKSRPRSQSRNRTSTTEEITTPIEIQIPEAANEIGLKIHTTGKNIVPTLDPHSEFILQQIKSGTYKWTYTDSRYDENRIRQLLSMHKIKITKHDFRRIDEGSFRKIRNGLDSRSPPEEIRKAKK